MIETAHAESNHWENLKNLKLFFYLLHVMSAVPLGDYQLSI